jgi:uncharacterized protein (UPF0276 family)
VKVLDTRVGDPRLGLAYGTGVPAFLAAHPGVIDYLEIPFEQLAHAPGLAALQDDTPFLLHCASMSIAGFVPPTEPTVASIAREAARTQTPWIGEHLAFVSADGLTERPELHEPPERTEPPEPAAHAGAPTSLTYTVCPQLSEETVERALANLAALQPRMPVPLILENSPQYFAVPGSTMSMVDFIRRVTDRSEVGLLLDLTHFLITAINTGADALAELDRMPLERVVEIHVSGLSTQAGVAWDDHASPAPAAVFELLARALTRARPRALTLEYNWSPTFPATILLAHVERARGLLAKARA